MSVTEYNVGMIVEHPKRPKWGPGKILAVDGPQLVIYFRDVPEESPGDAQKKIDTQYVDLKILKDFQDPWLDNIPPYKEGHAPRKIRLTMKQGIDLFLKKFPGGFNDKKYLSDRDFGERQYKWDAHLRFVNLLEVGKFEKLLSSGQITELIKRALSVESKVNILSIFEKAAFRDALKDVAAAKYYFQALFDLLATGPQEDVCSAYFDVVSDLPAELGKSRVATWPVATVLPFLAKPEVFMFLKPEATRDCAERFNFNLCYDTRPNWLTYQKLLQMCKPLMEQLKHYGAKDMIDLQSFIWCIGKSQEFLNSDKTKRIDSQRSKDVKSNNKNASTLKVGSLVNHPNKPEWGTGEVVSVTDTSIHIFFPNSPKRETKIFNRIYPYGPIGWAGSKGLKTDIAPSRNSCLESKKTSDYDLVKYFEQPDKSLSFRRLLKPKNFPPDSSGVYGVFFDSWELPPYVPCIDCSFYNRGWWRYKKSWMLLYVGKTSNLRESIINEHHLGHLVRDKAMSSLRQSLGCLLSQKLKICLWKFPDFPRREYTFDEEGEAKLTKWIINHARIAWVETKDYIELGKKVIGRYTLPLNTEGNVHFFIEPLQQLIKDMKECAKFLASIKKPKREVRKAYKRFVKECKRLGISK